MKRWLSILVALAVIASCQIQGMAEAEEEDYQYEINIIRALDLIDEVSAADFQAAASVSRSEYLVYVMEMLGYDGGGSSSSFVDVRPGHWAAGYIAQAEALGIVTGYDSTSFRPDQQTLLGEAVKILLCAMGYGVIAEDDGGYPAGYMAQASRLGILDGISAQYDTGITKGIAVKLLFNATKAPAGTPGVVDNGTTQYTIESDGGILEKYHSIYTERGIVTANSQTGLSETAGTKAGYISVDGTLYSAGGTNAEDYLGYQVLFYYREEPDGERTILYIEPNHTAVWEITPEEIESFADHTYYLYRDSAENGRPSRYKITAQSDVIYNGKAVTQYDTALLLPEEGSIRLIDNDNDSVYEVLLVNAYQIAVVQNYDNDARSILDKITQKQYLLESYESCTFENETGAAADESALRENSVLFIMESLDGGRIHIVVSNRSVNGQVSMITPTEDGAEYTIDNTVYKVSETCLQHQALEVGDAAYFALDANGTIRWIYGEYNSTVSYGYLVAAGSANSGFERMLAVKLLSAGGQFLELFTAPDKVTLDGRKNVSTDEVLAAVSSNGSVVPQLIGYKLDRDGRISMIDTVGEITSSEDSLTLEYETSGSHRYKARAGVVSGLIGVTAGTVLFGVPSDTGDLNENHYTAGNISMVPNDTIFHGFKAYRTTAESPLTTLLVVYDYASAGVEGETPLTVITDIASSINSEGEEIPILYVVQNGSEYRYPLESTEVAENIINFNGESLGEYALGAGDTIRIALNGEDEITSIELHYDKSEEAMLTANPTNGYTGAPGLLCMYVYKKVDDMIICSYSMPNGDMTSMTDELLYFKATAYSINLYDDELEEKARAGSINDIRDYEHYGEACSKVYVQTWYGEATSMVVYR